MKYFLHDTNAFQDEKISELYMHFGYEGLGLFYTILEKIAAQEKPIKTSVLKSQLHIGKRLEKCWAFMEQTGIICSSNGETFNKQLMNYAESYKIKKEKNTKRISEWRENQSDTKNVTHSEQVSNDTKGIVIEDIVLKKEENISPSKKSQKIEYVPISITAELLEKYKKEHWIDWKNRDKIISKKYEFTQMLKPFIEKYGKEVCNTFWKYWTEPAKNATGKIRWEGQEYFDFDARLRTFAKSK